MARWKVALGLFALLVGTFISVAACSAGQAALDTIAEAYAPYRVAVSYLRAGETDLADVSLQEFIDKWERAMTTLASPPAPFDADPKFAASLKDVLKAAKDAQDVLAHGDAAKALADLQPIRGILADVRQRNGIVTLSDCIDDVSNQMSLLQRLREVKFDLNDPAQSKKAHDVTAALGPILGRCAQQPPVKNKEQFDRLIRQASSSIESAQEALTAHDADRFIRIVRELLSIDHILFQQFD